MIKAFCFRSLQVVSENSAENISIDIRLVCTSLVISQVRWCCVHVSLLMLIKASLHLYHNNQLENVLAQFQLPRRSNEFNKPTQKHAYTSLLHTSLLIGHQLSVCGWRGLKKRIFTHQACISFLKKQKMFKIWLHQLVTFCWFKTIRLNVARPVQF